INSAHGSISEYDEIISNVRKVADIPIIFDVKGPEIRIQSPADETVKRGQVLDVGLKKGPGRYFNRSFYKDVSVGDIVFVSDGLIKTKIVEKNSGRIKLKVLIGGFLRKNKGVNIPGKHLHFNVLTPWDKEVISYAKKMDVDFIALSFTRTERDVKTLKKILASTEIGVISKIESRESLDHLPAIVDASDGIMVARGDLGVEVPSERLPIIQKQLIGKCNRAGKFVVVATEMLKSMIWEARPTRAETNDVANAILDGADGVMLSDETAIGKYPVEAVWEMTRIAREVEGHVKHKMPSLGTLSVDDSISNAVHRICERLPVSKVVTVTRSGYTARMISRYRMNKKIIALTDSEKVRKKLELVYGVHPVLYEHQKIPKLPDYATFLYKQGLVSKKDLVLFTAGVHTKKAHITNMIQIHKIRDLLEYMT
ncbi:MAG: pyruvate kinase, partial [Methanobacteriota archaeon]